MDLNIRSGKKGFLKKVELVALPPESSLAHSQQSSSSSSSSSGGQVLLRREARNCSCSDAIRCKVIQSAFYDHGKVNRVGYTKVTGSGKSKANERFSLYCDTLGIEKAEDLNDEDKSTLYVAFSHFPPKYLDDVWNRLANTSRIDFTVDEKKAELYGFERTIENKGAKYHVVTPLYTYEQCEAEIDELRMRKKMLLLGILKRNVRRRSRTRRCGWSWRRCRGRPLIRG
jgi:hypothetical protein